MPSRNHIDGGISGSSLPVLGAPASKGSALLTESGGVLVSELAEAAQDLRRGRESLELGE